MKKMKRKLKRKRRRRQTLELDAVVVRRKAAAGSSSMAALKALLLTAALPSRRCRSSRQLHCPQLRQCEAPLEEEEKEARKASGSRVWPEEARSPTIVRRAAPLVLHRACGCHLWSLCSESAPLARRVRVPVREPIAQQKPSGTCASRRARACRARDDQRWASTHAARQRTRPQRAQHTRPYQCAKPYQYQRSKCSPLSERRSGEQCSHPV